MIQSTKFQNHFSSKKRNKKKFLYLFVSYFIFVISICYKRIYFVYSELSNYILIIDIFISLCTLKTERACQLLSLLLYSIMDQ